MWPERGRLETLTRSDAAAIIPVSLTLALKILGAVVAMLAFVAAADYLFQYRQWYERQKMSLRELKDEFKQTEGDPAIKGKMKQVQQVRMRRRMIGSGPEGDGHHYQPDALCGRPRIRMRDGRAGVLGKRR